MNPKTLTAIIGAAIAIRATAIALVTIPRQQGDPGPTAEPPTSRSSALVTPAAPKPSASPTTAQARNDPDPLPLSEVGAGDATPGTLPYSQTKEARHQWEPIAAGFGRALTDTHDKTPAQWRRSLTPFVTTSVDAQLPTVDLRNLPKTPFIGTEPAEYGEDRIAVFARYDEGLTMVLYLTIDGESWRIYAYDRWDD